MEHPVAEQAAAYGAAFDHYSFTGRTRHQSHQRGLPARRLNGPRQTYRFLGRMPDQSVVSNPTVGHAAVTEMSVRMRESLAKAKRNRTLSSRSHMPRPPRGRGPPSGDRRRPSVLCSTTTRGDERLKPREKRILRWALLFLAPNLTGFLIFTSLPVLFSFGLAFFQWDTFSAPRFIGFDNFHSAADRPQALVLSLQHGLSHAGPAPIHRRLAHLGHRPLAKAARHHRLSHGLLPAHRHQRSRAVLALEVALQPQVRPRQFRSCCPCSRGPTSRLPCAWRSSC